MGTASVGELVSEEAAHIKSVGGRNSCGNRISEIATAAPNHQQVLQLYGCGCRHCRWSLELRVSACYGGLVTRTHTSQD